MPVPVYKAYNLLLLFQAEDEVENAKAEDAKVEDAEADYTVEDADAEGFPDAQWWRELAESREAYS